MCNSTTDQQAYASLLGGVFGTELGRIDAKHSASNEVVKALNSRGFDRFTTNFTRRLQRLALVYETAGRNRVALIRKSREIAELNLWQGAMAELAALDFFHSARGFLPRPVDLDVTVPATRTFAEGASAEGIVDLDCHFPRGDVYSDVKCLKDIVAELLAGIFEEASKGIPLPLTVRPEHRFDISFEEIQASRTKLVREIRGALENNESYIRSASVPGLSFRVSRGTETVITEHGYSPYRHAEETHQLAFSWRKKFLRDRPFFLTLVCFPWFNGVITSFRDSDKIYFRAFARRVFCQYEHSPHTAKDGVPLRDLARAISGLLFLEDNCITAEDASQTNVKGFLFLNPNATHNLADNPIEEYFRTLDLDADDFGHDNY